MKAKADIADVLAMIKECALTAEAWATTHSVFIQHEGKVAELPKGPGVINDAMAWRLRRIDVPRSNVRKLVQYLSVPVPCAHLFFPALVK